MKDVVNEKINTIIVKDLSRFGRNYIEVGKYLEQAFPLYNVRFIAINDNIDSYKDPKNKHKFIIDKKASKVVKKIFLMALKGKSKREIVDYLNTNEILTPAEYKKNEEIVDFKKRIILRYGHAKKQITY